MNCFKLKLVFIFSLLLLMVSNVVFAECWIVSGFKGYGCSNADNYNIHKDGLTGMTFMLNINGNKSSVIGGDGGSNEINFMEVTPGLIVGIKDGVIETWGIDVKKKKAFYTQSKSGYSIFDGAKMFVGNLDGKCMAN
jgi:hypothetical protein